MKFNLVLIWLLLVSVGTAVEDRPAKHRRSTNSSSQGDSHSDSARHRKHPSQKKNEDATPTPSPEKKQVEEDSKHTTAEQSPTPAPANVATISPDKLREFNEQPPKVQQLIRDALGLTEQNLTYTYGSADPSAGGMDCSGFIYYVLTKSGLKDVPRDSSEQYAWIRQNSNFRAVLSRSSKSFEFRELRPGDLMFWSGTYKVSREIPISHVMIYLGTEKATKKRVMVGSSDGRSYEGIRRNGVSVFDFKMPNGESNITDPDLTARFEGYGTIPGLREVPPADVANNSSESDSTQKQKAAPSKKEKPRDNID